MALLRHVPIIYIRSHETGDAQTGVRRSESVEGEERRNGGEAAFAVRKKTPPVHLYGFGYVEPCCLRLPHDPALQKYFHNIGQFAGGNHNAK